MPRVPSLPRLPRLPRPAGRARPAGRRRAASSRGRSLALLVVLTTMFAVIVVRLAYVQVLGAARYVAYGVDQRIKPIELAGGRGAIYDREGRDLAISTPRTSIAAD